MLLVGDAAICPGSGLGAMPPSFRVGPRAVQMLEAYALAREDFTFNHMPLDKLLRKHVDREGRVDYAALERDSGRLNAYLKTVSGAPFDQLGRDEKLALLLNAYNAFTLRLILDYWNGGKLKSIRDIPAAERWDDRRWKVGAYTWSLNEIEHKQIRSKFKEPRIHFALVCAAIGCPKLRAEAYQANCLEAQLEGQTRYIHEHDRWLQFDAAQNVIHLTKLYEWYGGDFEQDAGSVLAFVARYVPGVRRVMESGRKPRIMWLDYDWNLNRAKIDNQ